MFSALLFPGVGATFSRTASSRTQSEEQALPLLDWRGAVSKNLSLVGLAADNLLSKLGKILTHRGPRVVEGNRVGAQIAKGPESLKRKIQRFINQTQSPTHLDAGAECRQRGVPLEELILISWLCDPRQKEPPRER